MKRVLKCILLLIILGGGIFVGYKVVRKMYLQYLDNKRSVACLYEALSFRNYLKIDTTAHHILCIGNSITLHGPSSKVVGSDSLWTGRWGMCASLPDSDYVHRLEVKFKSINPNSDISIVHMADWEANLSLPIESFLKDQIHNKDIVIVRLGENVSNAEEYEQGYANLVSYLLKFTKNIIITGNYWHNSQTESYMIKTARENHLPYVPLSWIMDLYRDKVMFHVGDTIYNTQMKPYTIKSDFITTHPNDYGMKLIADAIWEAISVEN